MTEYTDPQEREKYDVSASWQEKFEILEQIGANKKSFFKTMKSPEFNALNNSDKRKVSFNIFAMLTGPFYYFFNQMWMKGCVIWGAVWLFSAVLLLIENITGINFPNYFILLTLLLMCASMANYDYYKQVTINEKMWPSVPAFFHTKLGAGTAPLIAAVVVTFISITTAPSNPFLDDFSGVWETKSGESKVEIDFDGNNKKITINGNVLPITIKKINRDKDVLAIGLTLKDGNDVVWAFQQIHSEDDEFYLYATYHTGDQEALYFVEYL